MKQYSLGPNGAIVTSLNLFATKFNDVINLIEKSNPEHKLCVFDTPGQIEVFTWSVSGTIVTESLASSFPTVVIYVMDTVRSVNPVTFMSNMLYACSILYKTRLPFIIVMNKVSIICLVYRFYKIATNQGIPFHTNRGDQLFFRLLFSIYDFLKTTSNIPFFPKICFVKNYFFS